LDLEAGATVGGNDDAVDGLFEVGEGPAAQRADSPAPEDDDGAFHPAMPYLPDVHEPRVGAMAREPVVGKGEAQVDAGLMGDG